MKWLKRVLIVLLFLLPIGGALLLTLNYVKQQGLEGRAVSELLKKEMELSAQQAKVAEGGGAVSQCQDALAIKADLKPKGSLPTGVRSVWATDDGERFKRLADPQAASHDNVVWNGCYVDLVAVRDEVVAFQLVLEGGASGAHGLTVKMDSLVHRDGHKIGNDFYQPGGDKKDLSNSVGRHIEVFREDFLRIKEPSRSLYFSKQRKYLLDPGEWVDPLTPVSVADAHRPLELASGRVQPYWVDIYVPRGTPSGSYYGWISVVTPDSGDSYQVPVRLFVADLELPREFSLQTMAYLADSRQIRRRHGVESGTPEYERLLKRYQQLLHRHRIDLVVDKPVKRADQQVANMLNGSVFTTAEGYEGPAEGEGTQLLFTQLNTSSQQTLQQDVAAWSEWFKQNKLPWSSAAFYVMDEPAREDYPTVIANSVWAHAATPPMQTFLTQKINNDLVPRSGREYIDIWSMPAALRGYDTLTIRTRQQEGAKVGLYNGYAPATGTQLIDDYAVGMRTWGWIAYKFGLDSWYYWDIAYWHQQRADRPTDVWSDPLTYTSGLFGGSAENVGNGDGTLIYPGEDKLFPENDRRFAGPVASLRLKNWRRGVQDYELLKLAEAAGYGSQVKQLVQKMIPKALFEADDGEAVSWPLQGAVWERTRRQLIRLLAATKK